MKDTKQLCDKCSSEPISFEDFTSHYKLMKIKKALRLLVDKNIEAVSELIAEEENISLYYTGDLDAWNRMDDELKKFNI